ncbi:MAG: cation-translocating P-type ATPase [Aureliella sp.]
MHASPTSAQAFGDSGTVVPWHAMSADEVVLQLASDEKSGLTRSEVTERQAIYGANTLQDRRTHPWYQVLVRQFRDILILILVVAAGISLAVGELTDALTILAIVLLNGLLGFFQEWKAERAIAELRVLLGQTASVIRDSEVGEVSAGELVPGDLVLLRTGDRVPADLRFLESADVKIDESSLTGESISVEKSTEPKGGDTELAERSCMAWMGTAVTGGSAKCIVTAIGRRTEFGRIAQMTEAIGREATPLQRKLSKLGRQLGMVSISISLLIVMAGAISGKPVFEMFFTGISLAVAIVPEGLPAVVTLTLALGIRQMVKRKALLRRLRAAEGLGSATVICTDKTGTLTQNQMTVRRIWLPDGPIEVTGVGYDPAGRFEVTGERIDYQDRPDLLRLLETGLECNHAHIVEDQDGWQPLGEPTECALVTAASKACLEKQDTPPIREYAFSSARKRMSVVQSGQLEQVAHVKGAPDILLPRCEWMIEGEKPRKIDAADRIGIETQCEAMASSGMRTLALARREFASGSALDEESVESGLTLLGIVGMLDPPRPEAADAVRRAMEAGIRIFVITGDSATTAVAIAEKIGLRAQEAITGSDLQCMSDDALRMKLRGDVLFARTTPEHKLRIVGLLQADGEIVGMTGDGVNDAPALKKADIGIAMGLRGTDVAKGAADIVLTDDNFSSIVGAIEEGRRQFDNIQKFVRYLLSSNTGEVIAIFLNILVGGPLILLPVQILWMNLVTDGLTAVALGLEPAERTVMRRPPRNPAKPVIDRVGLSEIVSRGLYIGFATLSIFQLYSFYYPGNAALAQTMAFTGIILIEKANVLNYRSFTIPLSRLRLMSNPWLVVAITVSIGLQVAAVYVPFLQEALNTVPIGLTDWAVLILFAAPIFLVPEIRKIWASSASNLGPELG